MLEETSTYVIGSTSLRTKVSQSSDAFSRDICTMIKSCNGVRDMILGNKASILEVDIEEPPSLSFKDNYPNFISCCRKLNIDEILEGYYQRNENVLNLLKYVYVLIGEGANPTPFIFRVIQYLLAKMYALINKFMPKKMPKALKVLITQNIGTMDDIFKLVDYLHEDNNSMDNMISSMTDDITNLVSQSNNNNTYERKDYEITICHLQILTFISYIPKYDTCNLDVTFDEEKSEAQRQRYDIYYEPELTKVAGCKSKYHIGYQKTIKQLFDNHMACILCKKTYNMNTSILAYYSRDKPIFMRDIINNLIVSMALFYYANNKINNDNIEDEVLLVALYSLNYYIFWYLNFMSSMPLNNIKDGDFTTELTSKTYVLLHSTIRAELQDCELISLPVNSRYLTTDFRTSIDLIPNKLHKKYKKKIFGIKYLMIRELNMYARKYKIIGKGENIFDTTMCRFAHDLTSSEHKKSKPKEFSITNIDKVLSCYN